MRNEGLHTCPDWHPSQAIVPDSIHNISDHTSVSARSQESLIKLKRDLEEAQATRLGPSTEDVRRSDCITGHCLPSSIVLKNSVSFVVCDLSLPGGDQLWCHRGVIENEVDLRDDHILSPRNTGVIVMIEFAVSNRCEMPAFRSVGNGDRTRPMHLKDMNEWLHSPRHTIAPSDLYMHHTDNC
ncbi:hypothetical protein BKA67DRAFT_531071 [Truncatella angustata]|uniref:Uncharacterized protein n=1 Tax=Truncatella angustata TaxID=152316 RepID=A0A9P9A4C3_9PEZI|nr:uncharacterized protein BKA67DRAFT_531071 [Truncatella angustata]KAH6660993.1 hypothetical protein BKA67DRAFT_531071 [Truncatella angustata]